MSIAIRDPDQCPSSPSAVNRAGPPSCQRSETPLTDHCDLHLLHRAEPSQPRGLAWLHCKEARSTGPNGLSPSGPWRPRPTRRQGCRTCCTCVCGVCSCSCRACIACIACGYSNTHSSHLFFISFTTAARTETTDA
ncbi:hypothetical protein K456DRAFT_118104 [Colletotrichum gloeosporioides 23]|nr:hypothetical protein K456DRAFT_118104 [Colletotrichum gloeosporioides 23]